MCVVLFVAGQRIAIRLSRRINVVSKSLRCAIVKFNSQRPVSQTITWEGITQLGANQPGCIPQSIQYKAVRLHHSVARATEEEFRILAEMRNTVQHYLRKISLLQKAIEVHTLKESAYDRGEHSLLLAKKSFCVDELARLSNFGKFGEFPELSQFLDKCEPFDSHEKTCDADLESIGSVSPLSECEEDIFSEDDYSDQDPTLHTTYYDMYSSENEMHPTESTSETPSVRPADTPTVRPAERQETTASPTQYPSQRQHTTIQKRSSQEESRSSEEEMEVQTWRKEKLFRDEFIETTRVHAMCVIMIDRSNLT